MCVIRRALYSCLLDKKNQNYLYPLWLLRKCKKCKEFLKMEKVKIRTGDMRLVMRPLYSSLLDKYSKFSYPSPRCLKNPTKSKETNTSNSDSHHVGPKNQRRRRINATFSIFLKTNQKRHKRKNSTFSLRFSPNKQDLPTSRKKKYM